MKLKRICIDLDDYTDDKEGVKFSYIVQKSLARCKTFGDIIQSKKTRNGWHIKIRLSRQVSFWRSIEIRYYCMDDVKRMFFDIMRYRNGGKMIDVCFDQKNKLDRYK